MGERMTVVRPACLFCGVPLRESQGKRGLVWVNAEGSPYEGARVICEAALGFHRPSRGPEDGHTFRVSVVSRGSYAVEGVEGHTDAEDFMGPVMTVDVRAWNLPEAVRRASFYPLALWLHEDADGLDS